MLEVRDIYSGYHRKSNILKGISFQAEVGEFICILGANGCGKTTLLKTLLRILRPTKGSILLDGEEVGRLGPEELARRVAYIPQAHVPPFSFRVRDVVLMGRTAHMGRACSPKKQDYDVAEQLMERFGLTEIADEDYTSLSGGQRQMVIIARALAQEPRRLMLSRRCISPALWG